MLVPNWLLVIGSAILLVVAGSWLGTLGNKNCPGILGIKKKWHGSTFSGIEPPTFRIKQRRVPTLLARSLEMRVCAHGIF